MFVAEYNGINSFLVEASKLLLKNGVVRNTRGYKCRELSGPFMFKIKDPRARLITIPCRKWNPILPFAESLWLATGRNDMALICHYLDNMKNFSDDGIYMRGGYGPRLRHFNGIATDYKIDVQYRFDISNFIDVEIDQFKYISESFKRDINTRKAIISIGDPPKDDFDDNGILKETKDYPCTRLLHFQKQAESNKLDLTVYMRSNDFVWGASAVNIFNFTLIQEYIAQILGLELGDYYHVANNFHYYEQHDELLKQIAVQDHYNDDSYNYYKKFDSLESFDLLLSKLQAEEGKLRRGENTKLMDFEDDFFNDWYKTLYCFNLKKRVEFVNPIMNVLFEKYMKQ